MADDIARFGAELEISKLRRDVTAGMAQLDRLDRQADKTSRGIKNIGVSARGLATAFAAVAAAGVGIGFVGKQLFDLGATAFETQSKFDTVFGSSAAAVDEFGQSFGRMAGLSRVAAQEVLATTGAIVQGMGFSREASAGFSQSIITLAGDLASFNNIPTAETARAIQAALTGERESLKRLGVVILETDVQKRALLATGKANAKQLTQEEKATATLALITERAGVAVGDLVRTQDSAANRAKQLSARFSDLANEFATSLLPALSAMLPVLDSLVAKAEGFAGALSESVLAVADMFGLIDVAGLAAVGGVGRLPGNQLAASAENLRGLIATKETRLAEIEGQTKAGPKGFGQVPLFPQEVESLAAELVVLHAVLVETETRLKSYTDTIKQADKTQQAATLASGGGFAGFMAGATAPGFKPASSRVPNDVRGQMGRALMADAEMQFADLLSQTDEWFKALEDGIRDTTEESELAAFRTKQAWEAAGVGAILAAGRALEAALRGQGGFGGLVGAIGGLVGGAISVANPLLGAGILAGSGILGAAFSGSDDIDPAPVRIVSYSPEALDQRRGRGGPENVTIQIIRSDTGILEAEYELNRATARDAIVRIPVGNG